MGSVHPPLIHTWFTRLYPWTGNGSVLMRGNCGIPRGHYSKSSLFMLLYTGIAGGGGGGGIMGPWPPPLIGELKKRVRDWSKPIHITYPTPNPTITLNVQQMPFWYTNSQKTPYYGRGDTPAPPPTPIEPWGYLCSFLITETPYLGYWLSLAITKNTPFSRFSWAEKSSQDYGHKITPLPEKMGIRMRPPHAFEWGGGGGGEGGGHFAPLLWTSLLPLLLYHTPEEGYSWFPWSLKPWEWWLQLTSHIQAGIPAWPQSNTCTGYSTLWLVI